MARKFAKVFLQLVLKEISFKYFCVAMKNDSLKWRGNSSFDWNFGCLALAKQCFKISIKRKGAKEASVHILCISNIISLLKYLIEYWLEVFPPSSSSGNNSQPCMSFLNGSFNGKHGLLLFNIYCNTDLHMNLTNKTRTDNDHIDLRQILHMVRSR